MAQQETDRTMSEYERDRQRHLARAMDLIPDLIEHLDWSADRLAMHSAALRRYLIPT
jgi:hypothetical protein